MKGDNSAQPPGGTLLRAQAAPEDPHPSPLELYQNRAPHPRMMIDSQAQKQETGGGARVTVLLIDSFVPWTNQGRLPAQVNGPSPGGSEGGT